MRRLAVALALAVLALGAVFVGVPYLVKERDYPASVPSPPPLTSVALVRVPPGESACMPYATMDPRSAEARFRVGTNGRPGVPLELRLSGVGVAQRIAIAARYADNDVVHVPVRAPARASAVQACVANRGRHAVYLYGSADPRSRSRSVARVAGRDTGISPQVAFYERRPASILERLPATMARASAFRPGFVGPWLLWPLLVLLVLGMPALVVWAISRALR
jgi:hypothetical protein